MGSTQIICEDYTPLIPTSITNLSENFVNIWLIRISSHLEAISSFKQVLSKEEMLSSSKYRLLNDTENFVIRRGILRFLLAKYTHCKPGEIEFAVGPNRKPLLKTPGNPVHFNVSHSNDLALIALSTAEVGIDVEQIKEDLNYHDVLKNAFSANEISLIESNENPRKLFFSLWTRKEALLKATSKGLDDHLAFIPCLDGNHIIDTEILGSNGKWTVRSFTPEDTYEASIAHVTGLTVNIIESQPELFY